MSTPLIKFLKKIFRCLHKTRKALKTENIFPKKSEHTLCLQNGREHKGVDFDCNKYLGISGKKSDLIPPSKRFDSSNPDIRYALDIHNDYSYESLAKKPDMTITEVTGMDSIDITYSVNGKKIGTAAPNARVSDQSPSLTVPTISISQLLEKSNTKFKDIFSKDVFCPFTIGEEKGIIHLLSYTKISLRKRKAEAKQTVLRYGGQDCQRRKQETKP